MRALRIMAVLAAAAGLAAFDGGTPAAAQWCAQYDWYTYNCGFYTHKQCLDTISGIGGYCRPDYQALEERERRARKPPPRERRRDTR